MTEFRTDSRRRRVVVAVELAVPCRAAFVWVCDVNVSRHLNRSSWRGNCTSHSRVFCAAISAFLFFLLPLLLPPGTTTPACAVVVVVVLTRRAKKQPGRMHWIVRSSSNVTAASAASFSVLERITKRAPCVIAARAVLHKKRQAWSLALLSMRALLAC